MTSCRRRDGSGGRGHKSLSAPPSWALEVPWEVLTVGLDCIALDSEIVQPSGSLLKLALTFFSLITLLSILTVNASKEGRWNQCV